MLTRAIAGISWPIAVGFLLASGTFGRTARAADAVQPVFPARRSCRREAQRADRTSPRSIAGERWPARCDPASRQQAPAGSPTRLRYRAPRWLRREPGSEDLSAAPGRCPTVAAALRRALRHARRRWLHSLAAARG